MAEPPASARHRTSESARSVAPDSFEDEPAWLVERLDQMVDAWNRGERGPLGSVLDGLPEIDEPSAIRLLYEDICIRRDAGVEVRTDDVLRQFPKFRDRLELLLGCDRLLQPTKPARLPEPGERLGDFGLRAILGEGATGRTFLADQPNLADRLVVLKVLPLEHDEHLSLARLQHSFIVPLFSEHDFPELGLRALCMPYLGGTDLWRILDALQAIPVENRTWRDVIDALDRTRSRSDPHQGIVAPLRKNRDRISYVKGVCLITSFLAEALHYAHERGLVHMDIKPSNVLIAADGEPMLLDFHLAQPPIKAGGPIPARLGGTAGYMSPEQSKALDAVRHDRPIEIGVDRRSDIYSLGLVLAEILGGQPITPGQRPARIDRLNRHVSVGLADLVEKCIATRPEDRYASAEALAEDLKRHFRNEPLRGVRNRNLSELWTKWRQRRPDAILRLLAPLLVAVTAIVLTLGFLFTYWLHSEQSDRTTLVINHTLQTAERMRMLGHHDEARKNLGLVEDLVSRPGVANRSEIRELLSNEMRSLDDALLVRHVRLLASHGRKAVGALDSSRERNQEFLQQAGRILTDTDLWNPKGILSRLDATASQSLKDDLFDAAIAWMDLRKRSGEPAAARADLLKTLDRIRERLGTSDALQVEARRLLDGRDLPSWLNDPGEPPTTASAHAQFGRALLRAGRTSEALGAFRAALRSRPDDPWTQFHAGLCALRLKMNEEAAVAFSVSIALAPRVAAFYYHRALVDEARQDPSRARDDYESALAIDPTFVPALLNHGILYYHEKRYPEAIRDFERALSLPVGEHKGGLLYNLALAQFGAKNLDKAIASAREAERVGHPGAAALITHFLSNRPSPRP